MPQWFVLVLYGIVAALLAYCVSLFAKTPLSAYVTVAGYQTISFIVSKMDQARLWSLNTI